MGNANVDGGSGRDVSRFSGLLLLVGAEETRVMTLLDHNKSNTGLVVRLKLDASLTNC